MDEKDTAEGNVSHKEKGLQVKSYLSELLLLLLPGKFEERKAGDVDAIRLMSVCGNGIMGTGHCESRKATSRRSERWKCSLGMSIWVFNIQDARKWNPRGKVRTSQQSW